MAECEMTAKKWGNSLGGVFPKEVVKALNLKENQKIHVLIAPPDNNVLRKIFGTMKGKFKKTAQQMKDDARRELYSD